VTVWNQREVVGRLRGIVSAVPLASTRVGVSSSTVAVLATVVHDLGVMQEIAQHVLTALSAPAPHPTWGDDGHRAFARERAVWALAWGERWVAVRRAEGWERGRRFYQVGDDLGDGG
jgi:hypothetical protein